MPVGMCTYHPLNLGDDGPNVQGLQRWLNWRTDAIGDFMGTPWNPNTTGGQTYSLYIMPRDIHPLLIDGVYGYITQEAVAWYQYEAGLLVDGWAGTYTINHMGIWC